MGPVTPGVEPLRLPTALARATALILHRTRLAWGMPTLAVASGLDGLSGPGRAVPPPAALP